MKIKAQCSGCGNLVSCNSWGKRHWKKPCSECGGTYFGKFIPKTQDEKDLIDGCETAQEAYDFHNQQPPAKDMSNE